MQPPVSVFDLDALEAASKDCRALLLSGPDDLRLRLRLAWCLFILALHQSGRETALNESNPGRRNIPLGCDLAAVDRGDTSTAKSLLRDCLQHNFIVQHLATSADDRKSAESLHELAILSGAAAVAADAEAECRRRFDDLMREVEHGMDSTAHAASQGA